MASPGADGGAPPPPQRLRRTRAAGNGVWQTGVWLRGRFRPSTDPPWLEQLLEGEDDARESRETTLEIHHHWFAHVRAALYRVLAALAVVAGLLGVPHTVDGALLVGAVLLAAALAAAARGRLVPVDEDVWSRTMRIGCVVAAIGLYAYATAGLLSAGDPSGLLLLLAPLAWLRGEWLWQATNADVLFVTTKRVFKVNSFLSKTMGAMPLRGLVDLTVHQPVLGRILGYGHLTFESAAQRQGLDKFHYVGDPLGVSKQIQARAYGGGPAGPGAQRQSGQEGGDGVSDISIGPVVTPAEPGDGGEPPVGERARPRLVPERSERIKMLSEIVPPEQRTSEGVRGWPWSRRE